MAFALTALAAAAAAPAPTLAAQEARGTAHWYRGNTHVHTTRSDGNASPADVVRWYRDHGYAFVVITDHERITDVAPLNARYGSPGRFLVLPGEEVTQQVVDSTRPTRPRQAHVVGIGVTSPVRPLGERGIASGVTIAATYARNLAAIRAAGGIAQVNHPNFRWSVGPDDMTALPASTLFEVWNAQPHINNLGGDDGSGRVALSTDALWDTLLTRGTLLYGVASDDAHKFRADELQDFEATRPGGGWVMVRADTLTPAAILAALRAGDFYATNGVRLEAYAATRREISLTIAYPEGRRDDRRFLTRFIGCGGRVLAAVAGPTARYAIRGDEGYVRATITDSNGRRAWTQPVWLGGCRAGTDHAHDGASGDSAATRPSAARALELPPLPLWEGRAPGAVGDGPDDRPSITPYLPPEGHRTGAAALIFAGGGYGHIAVEKEGLPAARWLNSIGVAAFVVRYRLGPRYHHPAMMHDAQRAVRLVRARAATWGIDPHRIGVVGFSAGGHLASTVATHFDRGDSTNADPVERESSRPDFVVLVYPVITMDERWTHRGSRTRLLGPHPTSELVRLLSNETQVSGATPPSFIVATTDDAGVPVENSLLFYTALHAARVPVELHLFQSGRHGFGLAPGDSVLSRWVELCTAWMRRNGWLGEGGARE